MSTSPQLSNVPVNGEANAGAYIQLRQKYWRKEMENINIEQRIREEAICAEIRDPSKRKKFWMVVGRGAPMVRHYNPDDAVAEAERICRKEKESVYIVEAMRYVIVKESPIEWTEMGEG